MEPTPFQQPLSNLAIIIQQGKILDFIDGHTQRPDTPEEYVRQEIAKSLVREYRYEKPNIEVEFTLRLARFIHERHVKVGSGSFCLA